MSKKLPQEIKVMNMIRRLTRELEILSDERLIKDPERLGKIEKRALTESGILKLDYTRRE